MKNSFFLWSVVFMISFLFINNGWADRRYFGRSYMANTLPGGALEFEMWNTGLFGKYSGFYYEYEPRFEFEYGVTDKLSASLYMNFDQVTADDNIFLSSPLSYSSSSIELKYRLSDPGDYFIDPAIYFEFSYGGNLIGYEGKAIFSKQFSNFVSAFNISAEIERGVIESEIESELELTAGLMYEFSTRTAAGFEIRSHSNYSDIFDKDLYSAWFIGPTVNIQTDKFFFTLNLLEQISGSPASNSSLDLMGHEKFEVRTIFGITL